MEYVTLGKSDLLISKLSFGCMSLENDDADNILHRARNAGINYFDTADLYQHGLNEEIVGKAFKSVRKQILLATKVGNQWRSDGSGWDWNPTKRYIFQAVEESLRRLQTDYIDLYQLHGGTIDDPIDETIDAFEILKKEGKIRHYGISSIRPNVIREWIARSNMVSVMMQYSLLDRRPEETILNLLREHRIGVLTRGNLASGLLIDKPAKPYLTYTSAEVQQMKDAVKRYATQRSPTAVALNFSLRSPAVTSTVVGIRTLQQLDESLQALAFSALTDEELVGLTRTITANTYQDHR
ncbi:aldo/keto reductase [Pseudochryseolinea flava]|uniref:Aldo/keto reductase n=2 Tax=Pseudochryseolinea flava TaxID=2059302 RepID=A0A364Y2G4_9BACT|nr:aldo/keto reductase [Pseudochryseolinea flava]